MKILLFLIAFTLVITPRLLAQISGETNGPIDITISERICFNYDEAGNRIKREVCTIRLDQALKSEALKNPFIKAYPNPTLNYVEVDLHNFDEDLFKDILVYDNLGGLIFEYKFSGNHIKLNTEGWISGHYLIMVRSNGDAYSKKIVKIS